MFQITINLSKSIVYRTLRLKAVISQNNGDWCYADSYNWPIIIKPWKVKQSMLPWLSVNGKLQSDLYEATHNLVSLRL